jgi:hypothetical protein
MSIIIDLVGSTVLGAFVLLIGLRLNAGVAATGDAAKADLNVQESLVDIVQTIEYDYRKIGFGVIDPKMSILYADTIRLRFLADIDNNGAVDTVEWWVGPPITTMPNPKIRAFFRRVSGSQAVAAPGLGVTEFNMVYRDVDGALVSTAYPVPASSLSRIWIIETTLKVESPYKVADQVMGTDKMVNAAAFWRQTRLASRNIKRHG